VPGDKWLILGTDLGNNEEQDHIPPDLSGTNVLVFQYCTSAVACRDTKNAWAGVFKDAHASSWNFLDPGEAQNAASPWS